MFSLNIKSVCSGAGARGSELHPRTGALLRQNKPLVAPSPRRVAGGDAGPSELLGGAPASQGPVSFPLSLSRQEDGGKLMDSSCLKLACPLGSLL